MAAKRGRSGLSLIELLVAMAIFLIGILAVLRIFPKALGLVGSTRDRADAVRLAEARLNDLRAADERLPEAILPAGAPTQTNPAAAGFGFLSVPAGADLNRPYDFGLNPAPGWTDVTDPGAQHRLAAADRLVIGEKVIVPRGVATGGGGALIPAAEPLLTLFGPIASGGGGAQLAVFRNFRAVDAADLRVTTVAGAFQDRPVYSFVDGGVDPFTGAPTNDRLLFELDAAPRVFIVRYAYRSAAGQTVPTQMPGTGAGASVLPGTTGTPVVPYQMLDLGQASVIRGSVSVRQALAPSATPGRFNYDPSSAGLGIVWLPEALAGETLSLEYVVDDWRNLGETYTVRFAGGGALVNQPPNGPVLNNRLQLRTNLLDDTYVPLIVLKASGQTIPVDTTAWGPDAARAGQVPLAMSTGLTGLTPGDYEAAVWFRRAGNWAVVPSVAPSSYILSDDAASLAGGSAANYPVPNTIVETRCVSVGGQGSFLELLFRPSEAGRSVAVSYEINTVNGHQTVSGELHVVPPQPDPTTVSTAPRHVVRLRQPLDSTSLPANTPAGPWVHAIEGLSVQVRVVYNDAEWVRDNPPPAPGQAAGYSRQRLYQLSWLVRRHR